MASAAFLPFLLQSSTSDPETSHITCMFKPLRKSDVFQNLVCQVHQQDKAWPNSTNSEQALKLCYIKGLICRSTASPLTAAAAASSSLHSNKCLNVLCSGRWLYLIVMDKVALGGMPDNEWAHILKAGKGKSTFWGAQVTCRRPAAYTNVTIS